MPDLSFVWFIQHRLGLPISHRVAFGRLEKLSNFEQSHQGSKPYGCSLETGRGTAHWRVPMFSSTSCGSFIFSAMSSPARFRESRRSCRVPLKVVIAIEDGADGRTSEGETIVVNLHGALMATAIGLTTGMGISIHVYLTDECAAAGVVYVGS